MIKTLTGLKPICTWTRITIVSIHPYTAGTMSYATNFVNFCTWNSKSIPEAQKQGLGSQQPLDQFWQNLLTAELTWSRLTIIYIKIVRNLFRVLVIWDRGQMPFAAPFGPNFLADITNYERANYWPQMGPISELGIGEISPSRHLSVLSLKNGI